MKQIIKSAMLDFNNSVDLNKRCYFRVGAPGTGVRVSDLPLRELSTLYHANHPDYVASTGEKRSRLDWCDRCDSYQPVDCFLACDNCKPRNFHDSCNADDY